MLRQGPVVFPVQFFKFRNDPRLAGVEKFVFVEDLGGFIRNEVAEASPRTPVNVGRAE